MVLHSRVTAKILIQTIEEKKSFSILRRSIPLSASFIRYILPRDLIIRRIEISGKVATVYY